MNDTDILNKFMLFKYIAQLDAEKNKNKKR